MVADARPGVKITGRGPRFSTAGLGDTDEGHVVI